jgi:hypothetical protein
MSSPSCCGVIIGDFLPKFFNYNDYHEYDCMINKIIYPSKNILDRNLWISCDTDDYDNNEWKYYHHRVCKYF